MNRLKFRKGFTLIELLVVISIIGILAAVLLTNINEGGAQSRDTKRQADLRNVQSALELYKNKNGEYPAGCNGAGTWSWQDGPCTTGTKYIQGLAPEFIKVLPVDPKTAGPGTGYAYLVNADRTVYKFVAFRTVEELFAIDLSNTDTAVDENYGSFRLCNFVGKRRINEFLLCSDGEDSFGGPANYDDYEASDGCTIHDSDMLNSYAVWGGYANAINEMRARIDTEKIICDKPQ